MKPLELTKVKKGWRFRSAHRNLNISKGNRPLRKEGFESVAKDHLVTQAQRGDPAGRVKKEVQNEAWRTNSR